MGEKLQTMRLDSSCGGRIASGEEKDSKILLGAHFCDFHRKKWFSATPEYTLSPACLQAGEEPENADCVGLLSGAWTEIPHGPFGARCSLGGPCLQRAQRRGLPSPGAGAARGKANSRPISQPLLGTPLLLS